MLEIDFTDIDWLLIRQALSLALLKNRPVHILRGRAFLERNPEYLPLFDDIAAAVSSIGAGMLFPRNESIVFEPHKAQSGIYRLESAPFSSSVEILLFLMPALFYNKVRSILYQRGVTHSVLSYPTGFVKEFLLKALEQLGFYASLTLRRFGFYGSGGGALESRIYPQEAKRAPIFSGIPCAISGATIYISRLGMELALEEKRLIAEFTGLRQDRISIMDVQDSDGCGNSIQVYIDLGGIHLILFREVRIYNEKGDRAFNKDNVPAILSGLSAEVNTLILDRLLPEHIIRELYPYIIFSGADLPHKIEAPPVIRTGKLCELILG